MNSRLPRIAIRLALSIAFIFAGTTLFPEHSASAEEPIEVGYVYSFDGNSENYAIVRGEERLIIQFFLPVHKDDQIELLADEGRVVLSLGGGSSLFEIETEDFPYPVDEAVQEPPTVSGNLYRQVGQWLSEQNDFQVVTGVTMGGRGSLALRVPGMAEGDAQVVAGTRAFGIAWWGGAPPFDVLVVNRENGVRVIDHSNAGGTAATDRYVLTEAPIKLVEGTYRVVIRDGRGAIVEGSFDAVPVSEAPVPPFELGPSTPDRAAAQTILAAWLAGQAEGIWALEALQRCLPMHSTYQPATALCRALAVGQTPVF